MSENTKKKLAIFAAGTGGHVYPGISIANQLIAENIDVIWIGTKKGIEKKLIGVKIDHDQINLSKSIEIRINSKRVGELRSGVYSPTFKKVIGIAMIDKNYFELNTKIEIILNNETKTGVLCNIPFV